MDVEKRLWIRPWMVVAVLAVVGISGAVVVTLAAKHQHKVDRADVARWERETMPSIRGAVSAEQDLAKADVRHIGPNFATTVHQSLVLKRATLDGVRVRLLSMRIPEILRLTAAEYLQGITFSLRAVSLLDEAALARKLPMGDPDLSEYEKALKDADAAMTRGESLLNELRCRNELPPCTAA